MRRSTVRDVMTTTVAGVREDATFKEIAWAMSQYGVSALPVLDARDHVCGLVSEADLLAKEERQDRAERHGRIHIGRDRAREKAAGVLAREL